MRTAILCINRRSFPYERLSILFLYAEAQSAKGTHNHPSIDSGLEKGSSLHTENMVIWHFTIIAEKKIERLQIKAFRD
jgi:hypothetical protein